MNITSLMLKIVQSISIITFLIFMFQIFIPKILSSKIKFKKYFFNNKKTVRDFLILTSFYIFLFSYLFVLNKNKTHILIYTIGFILSNFGLIIALIARIQLKKLWNPLTNIYNSKQILDKGIYSKIRHPIYLGRFLFFLGVMLMLNYIAIFITPLYWDYLRKKLNKEERYLEKVNPDYKLYSKKVKKIFF